MERFIGGNQAFRESFFREHADLFAELSKGQHPVALYIGCSDSRVPIELIAGALPGDLFVVRVLGNIVPPSYYGDAAVGAAVGYALDHLQVGHAIVCGHYGCGAIAAMAAGSAGAGFDLHLTGWLAYARPVLEQVPGAQSAEAQVAEPLLRRLVEENVRLQLANLRTFSSVQQAEQAGRLQLHGWIYDWEEGHLLEDRDGAFQPL